MSQQPVNASTPNEIVKLMVEGADWLCEKHFSKNLIDRDVEILDPATGTGTFICDLRYKAHPRIAFEAVMDSIFGLSFWSAGRCNSGRRLLRN